MKAEKLSSAEKLKEIEVFLNFVDSQGITSSIVERMREFYAQCSKSSNKALLTALVKEKNTLVRESFEAHEQIAFSAYQKTFGLISDSAHFEAELTVILERGVIKTDDEFETVRQLVDVICAKNETSPLLDKSNQMLANYESRK